MGGRMLLNLSSASSYCVSSFLFVRRPCYFGRRVQVGFKALCCSTSVAVDKPLEESRAVSLLEKLRSRHLKHANNVAKVPKTASPRETKGRESTPRLSSFAEMELTEELMSAVNELNISVPTEVQCLGIPAILEGKSIVLASHTGSGKTLAYMLPLVQLLRKDEAEIGVLTKPKRPRAVVLCPTRELSEQVFRVAKSISHHARFRSAMISGGGRMRPQEDALNYPIEMVVGTPGRLLQHIDQGNMVYGDIKYVVLDEADTMFDRGFGPELRKFLSPLRNRALKFGDQGFQTVLVTATITKAVQKLLDEEFQGILHIHTSTLHKKISSAYHDFIKLSGTENKLEALLQVLEPSHAKGNRVMVFCNTLNSSRAVDHFLNENQVPTVNYHGEVPAEKRVENLNKFKSDDGDCPTLVCTDLAARGLDLAVDHVIMFDFPLNPIDYLHRTGRTARMGAKGKVTSLVTKKDITLASQIEDAMRKNESLEALTTNKEKLEAIKQKQIQLKQNEKSKSREKTPSPKGVKMQRTGQTLLSKLGSKGKSAYGQKNLKGTANMQKTGQAMSAKKSIVGLKRKQASGLKNVEGTVKIQSTRQGSSSKPSGGGFTGKQTYGQKKAKGVKGTAKVWKTEESLLSKLPVVGFKGKQTSAGKKGKGATKIPA
eukprot:Gb_33379 [translate_table: standard]